MNSLAWGVVGALLAVSLEILYRKGLSWSGWSLLIIVPLALIVSYCISRNIQGGTTYFSALVWFSGMVAVLRISAGLLILNDPLAGKNLVAAGALLLASLVRLL